MKDLYKFSSTFFCVLAKGICPVVVAKDYLDGANSL